MQVLDASGIITHDMLAGLPEPVRRYLTYSQLLGNIAVKNARVMYTGEFRLSADKPWMQMQAEQFYTVDPPSFEWNAGFKFLGIPLMSACDTYRDGNAHMVGKLANLFTVFDAHDSKELLQGTMIRYLQEMVWFPTAYLSPYITWHEVDDHCADATFVYYDSSVTGRFYFDDMGRVVNFVAERYAENNGDYHLHTWSTPMTDYATFGDFRVPRTGLAIWQFPDEDLIYIKLTVNDIQYDVD